MTYNRITYIIKDDSSLPSGKGQSAAEGEQVSMKMKECSGTWYLFLFSLKQFGDKRAILDFNKPIQIHI